jgi:glycopeptide antibiotics resistance protein
MNLRRKVLSLLLSAYVLFLLDLALLRFHNRNPGHNAVPLHSIIGDWKSGGPPFVVNFVGNIVAFIPIGMIPSLAWPRRAGAWQAALFSLAFSAMIEVVQYTSGCRVADVDDLILNTLGGLLGYGVLALSLRLMRPASGKDDRAAVKGSIQDNKLKIQDGY